MKRILFATCAILCVVADSALAADMPTKAPIAAPATFANRWYIEARIGAPLPVEYDINVTGVGSGTYEPDTGIHVAFDIGYEFNRNWRAELEVTFTQGRDGDVVIGGVIPHSGRTDVWSVGANLLYSFDLNLPVRPFVGAGLGVANYRVHNLGAIGGAFVLDDNDTAFIVAGHAGLDFPLTRTITLTGRYTLAHTSSLSFASVPAGNTTTRDSSFDHILSGGLRFYLN